MKEQLRDESAQMDQRNNTLKANQAALGRVEASLFKMQHTLNATTADGGPGSVSSLSTLSLPIVKMQQESLFVGGLAAGGAAKEFPLQNSVAVAFAKSGSVPIKQELGQVLAPATGVKNTSMPVKQELAHVFAPVAGVKNASVSVKKELVQVLAPAVGANSGSVPIKQELVQVLAPAAGVKNAFVVVKQKLAKVAAPVTGTNIGATHAKIEPINHAYGVLSVPSPAHEDGQHLIGASGMQGPLKTQAKKSAVSGKAAKKATNKHPPVEITVSTKTKTSTKSKSSDKKVHSDTHKPPINALSASMAGSSVQTEPEHTICHLGLGSRQYYDTVTVGF